MMLCLPKALFALQKEFDKVNICKNSITRCQVPLLGDPQRNIYKKGLLGVAAHHPVAGTDLLAPCQARHITAFPLAF